MSAELASFVFLFKVIFSLSNPDGSRSLQLLCGVWEHVTELKVHCDSKGKQGVK